MTILRTLNPILVLFVTVLCLVSICNGQVHRDYTANEIARSDGLFTAGNSLMEQKKYADALVKYKEGLVVTPDSLGLLYNGGLAAFKTGDFVLALDWWKRLKAGDPNDMQARAKLIQAYQALGRRPERDAERAELFKVRNSGSGKALFDQDYYVRDQTVLGGRSVMVFEYFELKGDRAVRYIFYVLDENEKIEYRISLGSYETTNAVWRETTTPKPKEGERLFHLDGYYSWGHSTFGMYTKEPTYDETREIVKGILEKTKKPISSTSILGEPEKKP